MKNFKNYIFETLSGETTNNDTTNNDSLKDKLIYLFNTDGDDKEIRKLIDISDFDYEYEFRQPRFYQDPDKIIISGDLDEVADYLGEEVHNISTYINSLSYYPPDEYVDDEEIRYQIDDDNKKIIIEILKEFNINITLDKLDEEIVNLLGLKFAEKTKENIESEISYGLQQTKVKRARKIHSEVVFDLEEEFDQHDGDKLEIQIDIDELEGEKTVNSYIKSKYELLDLEDFQYSNLDDENYKYVNNEIKKYLTELLNNVKNNKEKILNNLSDIDFYNIMNLGGDFLKKIKSYDYQKKYIDGNVKNYEDLLFYKKIVNDKIKKDFEYLIKVRDFNL